MEAGYDTPLSQNVDHKLDRKVTPMTNPDLSTWTSRPRPGSVTLIGACVRLEPLDWEAHERGLFTAVGGEVNAGLWDHISVGPYVDPATFRSDFENTRSEQGWQTLVIFDEASNTTLGMFSFMRIRERHGSVEIGCVVFGHKLQRTRQATEALTLMACHAFDDLGYRRYEWKCDTQNLPSSRAALRFGFAYEGIFRNDMVNKGRNRDTAWYSITDAEWPAVKIALQAWLAPENFDSAGQQIKTLEEMRA